MNFEKLYREIGKDLADIADQNGGHVTADQLRVLVIDAFGIDARTYRNVRNALLVKGKLAWVGNPKTSKVFKFCNGVRQ